MTDKNKIKSQYQLEESRGMRQAISVAQMRDEADYSYNDLLNTKVKEKFAEERTSKLIKHRQPKIKTEPSLGYDSRIVQINNKLYEVVEDDDDRAARDEE